ncbi:MAG: sensor histidine kinase [Janthinobacterium lividum]
MNPGCHRLTCRFFHTEESRTSPGNGLGLALVSAVADLHGGQIRFSHGESGLRATLSLPEDPNIGGQSNFVT